jgi:hypothetical protein
VEKLDFMKNIAYTKIFEIKTKYVWMPKCTFINPNGSMRLWVQKITS